MKAIVLHGPKNVEFGTLPDPVLGSGDVKVKVSYCGICGSDFHKYNGKKNTRPIHYPVALGHEISGIVEAVGDGVTRFKAGDRVTVDPNWSCGECRYCKAGKPSFCENSRGVVKGMAEYVVAPQKNVYPLPQGMSLRDAALAEPVSCCLRGLDLLDLRMGERIALIGFGAIGTIMMCLLRYGGAGEIVVIDANEERRSLAMEMGASIFFGTSEADAIKRYSDENPIDRVIECVGIGVAQEMALSIAARGATVVMFGVRDSAERLPISFYDAFIKELTIRTSFVNPHTTERAIRVLSSGLIDTKSVISKVISMKEAEEEFRSPRHSKKGKVLVRIDATVE